jgi:hypothetical protein
MCHLCGKNNRQRRCNHYLNVFDALCKVNLPAPSRLLVNPRSEKHGGEGGVGGARRRYVLKVQYVSELPF